MPPSSPAVREEEPRGGVASEERPGERVEAETQALMRSSVGGSLRSCFSSRSTLSASSSHSSKSEQPTGSNTSLPRAFTSCERRRRRQVGGGRQEGWVSARRISKFFGLSMMAGDLPGADRCKRSAEPPAHLQHKAQQSPPILG